MISYDQLINEWNGKQVTRFGSECVALVAEYESENGRPIVWGNACQWANNPTMLSVYDWVDNNPNDPNQLPPRGAIIVWDANLPGAIGFGHIAFYDSVVTTGTFQSFGQNWGGPTAHFQHVSWQNVAGWYVEKPTSAPNTITAIEPKQLHVVANRNKWNLAQPTFDDVIANPITTSGGGVDFTAVATLTRSDNGFAGYTYYLEDASTPHGWNSLDCTDIVQQPMPTPYVPPAAPVTATPAEKYSLLTSLPYYASADETAKAQNFLGHLTPDSYYVWSKGGSNNIYWELSTSNMTNEHKWINTIDNKKPLNPPVVKPVPKPVEPPKPTVTLATPVPDSDTKITYSYRRFFANDDAVEYTLVKPYTIKDLMHGGKDIYANPLTHKIIYSCGYFYKDSICYLRIATKSDPKCQYYWYGIATTDYKIGAPFLENDYDYSVGIKYGLDKWYDNAEKTLEGIFHPIKSLQKLINKDRK